MATYYGGAVNGMQLVMDVTHTQNVAANTTTVTMNVSLIAGQWVSSANVNFQAAIAGVYVSTWYGSQTFNAGTTWLGGGSRTVTHNSDGTIPAFNVSATLGIPFGIPTSLSVGTSYQPGAIPRATTAVWAATGTKYIGTAYTLNLPRASSAFTHDVTFKWGTQTINVGSGLGASVVWTPPLSLLTEIPNASNAMGTFTTVTKSGSTVIGTTTSRTGLYAAAGVVPTVSAVVWDDANPTVKANIGAFVQGLSLVKGAVTAAGVYGSTITSRRVRIGDTALPEGTAFAIDGSGTVTASGEATDTRGRVGSLAANFTVLPYEPPHLGANGWQVRRANSSNVVTDQGTYLRLDLHALAQSLKPASTEKNALKVSVFTRPSSGGAWTARNVINPGLTQNGAIQISGGAAYPVAQSFDVKIELTDNTGVAATVLQTAVSTATVTLDMSGTKVGVGKYWERGALDVGGDIYADALRSTNGLEISGEALKLDAPIEFADTPPVIEVYRSNTDNISATSAAQFNITVANPTSITVTAPTWYRFILKGWKGTPGTELRVGIELAGATISAYNDRWGNVIRELEQGSVFTEKTVLLNPGTTNVRVMGYAPSGTPTFSYQVLECIPVFPGNVT